MFKRLIDRFINKQNKSELSNSKINQDSSSFNQNEQESKSQINKVDTGWFFTPLSSILVNQDVIDVYNILNENTAWFSEITGDWFNGIRVYKENETMRCLIENRHTSEDDELYIETKRRMTISAIYYEFSIPDKLVVWDKITLSKLLKYVILNQTVMYNEEGLKSQIQPTIVIKNIDHHLKWLITNPEFKRTMDEFVKKGYRYLPNIFTFWKAIITNTDRNSEFQSLDIKSFKKILTCYFLECGIALPKNYIYVDADLIDWLNKDGIYGNNLNSNIVEFKKRNK